MSITTFEKEPQSERTTKLVYAYSPEEAMRILQSGTKEEFNTLINELTTDTRLLREILAPFFNLSEENKVCVASKIAYHTVWEIECKTCWSMFVCAMLLRHDIAEYKHSLGILGRQINIESARRHEEISRQKDQAYKEEMQMLDEQIMLLRQQNHRDRPMVEEQESYDDQTYALRKQQMLKAQQILEQKKQIHGEHMRALDEEQRNLEQPSSSRLGNLWRKLKGFFTESPQSSRDGSEEGNS
jgi:hypothetical protein